MAHFRFLALPLELRLIVYEHALPTPQKPVLIWGNTWTDEDRKNGIWGGATSLLLTCHKVYEEASPQVKKAIGQTTFLIDFEFLSADQEFPPPHHTVGGYDVMENVLQDRFFALDAPSGLMHNRIPAYMPLDKIRTLQLRLRGTPLKDDDRFDRTSLLVCVRVVAGRLIECVNRCTKLEKFQVIVEAMGNQERWQCVDFVVETGAPLLVCYGEVEFVQVKGNGREMALDDNAVWALNEWNVHGKPATISLI